MPKASEVAAELRRIAGALEKGGETVISQPYINFIPEEKEEFLALVRLLPRPLYKASDDRQYKLDNLPIKKNGFRDWDAFPVNLQVKIDRAKVCRLVKAAQPAQYECEPLLSDEEEASLAASSVDEE